jgi:uncharacterized protein YxeA
MKKILLIVLALVIVGTGITAFYYYNKKVESLEHVKPEVEVSAHKLLTDYENDEKAANEVYLGKVIQVQGAISAILDEAGKKKIQLDAGSPMSTIICEMDSTNSIGQVKAGDEVKIKGLCSGYLSDVIVVQANVMK